MPAVSKPRTCGGDRSFFPFFWSFVSPSTALASILTAGPGAANFLALNEAACAVALLGTSFALIWIMMAKGSKAWYEVYERYIFEIEQEEAEGLKIPERYRLGALCRPWEMNGNLFSKKAGRYSPSRLNITIGSVTLTAWLTVGLIHYAASVILYAEGPALCWQPLILALIPPRSRRSRHGRLATCGTEPVAGEAPDPDFRK